MLAQRTNNENAIYQQQRTAAAKPLNNNGTIRGLAPKTPANVARGRHGRNDENTVVILKERTRGKDAVEDEISHAQLPDIAAYNTPHVPATRAPLGNKTTNARIGNLETPATRVGDHTAIRKVGPHAQRSKLRVHLQSDPLDGDNDDDDDSPEIERMPPRGEPLPDYPDEWPHDRTYPQFEGPNMTRGWFMAGSVEHDEEEQQLPRISEVLRKAEVKRVKEQQQGDKHAARVHRAVAALSSTSSASSVRGSSKAGGTNSINRRYPKSMIEARHTTSNVMPRARHLQHPAAKAVSNTTVGYSKGRSLSTSARTSQVAGETSASREGRLRTMHASRPFSVIDEWLSLDNLRLCEEEGQGDSGEMIINGADDDELFLETFQLPKFEMD